MKRGCVGVVALLVLACAGSKVQPYGPDRFLVSYGSVFGEEKARRTAVRDANKHCADKRLVMEPLAESLSISGDTTTFSLEFRCVAP